ncbi:MAG: type I-E CRISPR-associated protein Cse1/CasA [Desulfovibrio sp.]|nr:type I-E CRISPR-associated protein Cse1/CasA [Desulfovibrio sp.]
MGEDQRYNLLDEHWIPIAHGESVSLKDVFAKPGLRALGGSVLEKIALFKLLQAIAQAACTPKNDEGWKTLGEEGMARACLEYLETWRDAFWLYGPRPFLQYPAAIKANCSSYGVLMSEIPSDNATILFQGQVPPPAKKVTDALRARLLLTSLSCSLGGGAKKTEKSKRFPPFDIEDRKTPKPGPALCDNGILHSFLTGITLRQTVWCNLLTREDIESLQVYSEGVGVPPWEVMPQGENDTVAQKLKNSLMGRLVPMSRFLLLGNDGVHCLEGLRHLDFKARMIDPSMTSFGLNSNKVAMLKPEPARRPWRSLTSLLGFLDSTKEAGWTCLQIESGIRRLGMVRLGPFGIWSGGLKISRKSGEPYMGVSDDAVESEVMLNTDFLRRQWFDHLQLAMKKLDQMAFVCKESVRKYFESFCANDANGQTKHVKGQPKKKDKQACQRNAAKLAEEAEWQFWEKAEQAFQQLINACAQDEPDSREQALHGLRDTAQACYDAACPQVTARQLQLYAKHTPRFSKKASA